MAFEQTTMKVTPVAYARVTEVRAKMTADKGRPVTYSEVLEDLARLYDLVADAAAQRAGEAS